MKNEYRILDQKALALSIKKREEGFLDKDVVALVLSDLITGSIIERRHKYFVLSLITLMESNNLSKSGIKIKFNLLVKLLGVVSDDIFKTLETLESNKILTYYISDEEEFIVNIHSDYFLTEKDYECGKEDATI